VEWRASIEPMFKQESLPEIEDTKMLSPQVRGTIPSLAERTLSQAIRRLPLLVPPVPARPKRTDRLLAIARIIGLARRHKEA
jgi:hypothetical protein